jgi:hypothetical protein
MELYIEPAAAAVVLENMEIELHLRIIGGRREEESPFAVRMQEEPIKSSRINDQCRIFMEVLIKKGKSCAR